MRLFKKRQPYLFKITLPEWDVTKERINSYFDVDQQRFVVPKEDFDANLLDDNSYHDQSDDILNKHNDSFVRRSEKVDRWVTSKGKKIDSSTPD